MPTQDPRDYLWANICRALRADPEKPLSIDKVKDRLSMGRGTVQKLRGRMDSRFSTLLAVAEKLKLDVWQLLVPDFDPDHPPTLTPWPFGGLVELDRVQALKPAELAEVAGAINATLRQIEARNQTAQDVYPEPKDTAAAMIERRRRALDEALATLRRLADDAPRGEEDRAPASSGSVRAPRE